MNLTDITRRKKINKQQFHVLQISFQSLEFVLELVQ